VKINFLKHIEQSISNSNKKISKLTPEFFNIHDDDSCMTSHLVRCLLNNICSFENCNYLEIGSWRGSSFQSAIFENNITATCIDWWRNWDKDEKLEGKKSRDIFFRNLYETLKLEKNSTYKELKIIDNDAFSVNTNELKKNVNVYFYDGDHSKEFQYKGFTYFNNILAKKCIIIVDDWNSKDVRDGTFAVFKELKYKIIKQWELPGQNGNWSANSGLYWNGLYVCLINKT